MQGQRGSRSVRGRVRVLLGTVRRCQRVRLQDATHSLISGGNKLSKVGKLGSGGSVEDDLSPCMVSMSRTAFKPIFFCGMVVTTVLHVGQRARGNACCGWPRQHKVLKVGGKADSRLE